MKERKRGKKKREREKKVYIKKVYIYQISKTWRKRCLIHHNCFITILSYRQTVVINSCSSYFFVVFFLKRERIPNCIRSTCNTPTLLIVLLLMRRNTITTPKAISMYVETRTLLLHRHTVVVHSQILT